MKINIEMPQLCIIIIFFLQSQRQENESSNPLNFSIFLQLFPLVIRCERGKKHLLRDKWCGVQNLPMDTLTAVLTAPL